MRRAITQKEVEIYHFVTRDMSDRYLDNEEIARQMNEYLDIPVDAERVDLIRNRKKNILYLLRDSHDDTI